VSAEPARLHPDDVDAIARRMLELMRDEPAAADDRLLTAKQVAAMIGGVSERYVWRLGRRGAFGGVTVIGKYRRYREAGVRDYLEHRRQPIAVGNGAARVDPHAQPSTGTNAARRERLR
jgi:hypothetical protein